MKRPRQGCRGTVKSVFHMTDNVRIGGNFIPRQGTQFVMFVRADMQETSTDPWVPVLGERQRAHPHLLQEDRRSLTVSLCL